MHIVTVQELHSVYFQIKSNNGAFNPVSRCPTIHISATIFLPLVPGVLHCCSYGALLRSTLRQAEAIRDAVAASKHTKSEAYISRWQCAHDVSKTELTCIQARDGVLA